MKNVLPYVGLFATLLLFTGCGRSTGQKNPDVAQQPLRTDITPIEGRLERLGELEAVWWSASEVTIDTALSPPGNPAYRVVGFAKLSEEKSREISRLFGWQPLPAEWEPSISIAELDLRNAMWSGNDAFTKEYKPQHIPGELYFERQLGFVYFDLEIE